LITTVCQKQYKFINTYELILEQLEIVSFAHRLCNAYDFVCFTVYDDLSFDCVTLFLA
jgi:hypothetical protein